MDVSQDNMSSETNASTRWLDAETRMSAQFSAASVDGYVAVVPAVLKASLLFLVFTTSLTANLLVFAVFYHKPVLLKTSNKLLLHLSLVQCLLLLTLVPLWTASIFEVAWASSVPYICDVTGVAINTLLTVATYNVVLVSMDRLYAITQPLHYTRTVKCRPMAGTLLAIWTISLTVSLIPSASGWGAITYHRQHGLCMPDWLLTDSHNDPSYAWFVITVSFVIPCLILLVVYGLIYRTARNAVSRTRRHSVTPDIINDVIATHRRSSAASLTQFMCRRRSSLGTRSVTSLTRDDLLAAKTVILSVVSYVACWSPYYALAILDTTRHDLLPSWSYFVALYAVVMSCLVNPIVYVFRSKVVKETLSVTGYATLLMKICPCARDVTTGSDLSRPFSPPLLRGGATRHVAATGRTSLSSLPETRHILSGQYVLSMDHAIL